MIGQARRVELDVRIESADAVRCLRDDWLAFALVGAWAGGGAILGSQPIGIAGPDDDPFAVLDRPPIIDASPPADHSQDAVVGGGWFGYIGHWIGAERPSHQLAFYDHVLRQDAMGRWWFEMLWTPHRAAALADRERALAGRLSSPPPAERASAGDVVGDTLEPLLSVSPELYLSRRGDTVRSQAGTLLRDSLHADASAGAIGFASPTWGTEWSVTISTLDAPAETLVPALTGPEAVRGG